MRIDAARHDETAAGIDDLGAGRRFEIGADGGDRAVADEDIGVSRIVVVDDRAAAYELGHVDLLFGPAFTVREAALLAVYRGFVKAGRRPGRAMPGAWRWLAGGAVAMVLLGAAMACGRAADDTPTAQQIAAIRACAENNQDDVTEAERQCLFNLVAVPCQDQEGGQSTFGMARCFDLETRIWDRILNDNYNSLRGVLDAGRAAKLRDMQRAWIASRDATCGFYDPQSQGTIAIPMASACLARETARRALLLRFFTRL